MPEYLAPGVYVEETSFRSKSIEGVSTSTTAFVGPTRRGPVGGTPELLTSVADFARIYGSPARLRFGADSVTNHLALAVQAYFDNGGSRLYVGRVFQSVGSEHATLVLAGADDTLVALHARFPGESGNGTVTFSEKEAEVSGSAVERLPVGSVIRLADDSLAIRTASGFVDSADGDVVTPAAATALSLVAIMEDRDGNVMTLDELSYGATHQRYVGDSMGSTASGRNDDLLRPYRLEVGVDVTFEELRTALLGSSSHVLAGGLDGGVPGATPYSAALTELESLEDISIVAAPGHAAFPGVAAIRNALITHVEQRGLYRVAVLDSAAGSAVSEVRTARGTIDSDKAAMYYPWVTVPNPLARPGNAAEPDEVNTPPSGFLCGIYARNDVEHGVWKSPANEVVRGALRFERDISFGENEVLNPLGVNCLRYFPGRGYRVWGARTASSDPEWKYLSVRRYFNFLEASIERGTQWAVFESNGPALWANVGETIGSFLYAQWKSGALLGSSPKEAYFVRCDRTTMTQNDLDNGRMVCLVGVAAVKPAEFVVFRIGQKTANARD